MGVFRVMGYWMEGRKWDERVGYREYSLDLASGNDLSIQRVWAWPGGAGAGLAGVIRGRR